VSGTVARVSKAVRFGVRRATAAARVLPDYLVIGASRSGTTFLQAALLQHPAVLGRRREIHYFDWNVERGPGWYGAHFPTRAGADRVRRRHGAFATGERSPNYLFDPAVPRRVRALLPEVRLIVVLRNPVDRALSNFHHARRMGLEWLSFQDALAVERSQLATRCASGGGESAPGQPEFLARGSYAEQLERWLACFDREQIHVTLSERMFAEPRGVIGDIQRFLGLDPVAPASLAPENTGSYPSMPASVRLELQEFFAADVARLTELLGESPGWW